MSQSFEGWAAVEARLRRRADEEDCLARERGEAATRLNPGQRASLRAIADRIANNGVLIADEVGMGKTRIAVELARCVRDSGGRVALLVPPGLGYQWLAELHDGELRDVLPILRSLDAYLAAWNQAETEKQRPWFQEPVVLVSHAFTNWRLSDRAKNWRWALLPELYARWREATRGRLPNNYHDNEKLDYYGPYHAAQSIAAEVAGARRHPVRDSLNRLLDEVDWPKALDPGGYSKNGALRPWLEVAVGAGLGVFDLVVTDEAHKSRGSESGLSRLLECVVVHSSLARRLALTATPVELDVSQWHQTLSRLGLAEDILAKVQEVTGRYADAVRRLRLTWRSSQKVRDAYRSAAAEFQKTLSPYLIRRDKREDPDVLLFREHTRFGFSEYRKESEVAVETAKLSLPWRRAICAAESLSVVTRQSDDPVAKRLRLTLGNGHGIAALLDQDQAPNEGVGEPAEVSGEEEDLPNEQEVKRRQRADWWLKTVRKAFDQGAEALFDHPAILAAVEAVEAETHRGEKVLVFGRFTRPLRALVKLLNAREMLRRVENRQPWPQSKVHDDGTSGTDSGEWAAVRAAHRQLGSSVDLVTLDRTLTTAYGREQQRREQFRDRLVSRIEQGFGQHASGGSVRALFDTFKNAAGQPTSGGRAERPALAVVARAMVELLESPDAGAPEYAAAFCQLVEAGIDREKGDDPQTELDEDGAANLWEQVETELRNEYDRPEGGFARLMDGGTGAASRRMIQLAFNRPKSFPRVLVAQSLVGREGLNLHKACRVVVLLHPEWNPGVVEQQIGRVDRVDSHWCRELRTAVAAGATPEQTPRIEIRPVIFRGTYDEHNWRVLQTRWGDLRAQLHGIVIPPGVAFGDLDGEELLAAIAQDAPDFSPTHKPEQGSPGTL
jgi:superfamily II DNA or RNA helicase